VYPYFDTDTAKESVITVTNVNALQIYDQNTDTLWGDVFIKFYYVDGDDCSVTNREALLTPADTLTVLASEHNPAFNSGWLYIVAHDPWTKLFAIRYDGQLILNPPDLIYNSGLIGDVLVVDGSRNHLWAIPAIGIKANPKIKWKELADTNVNKVLEFGTEFEGLPSTLFISSFIELGVFDSEAYLILLTFLPVDFTVYLDFLFYNNDEEEFSQEWDFNCYANVIMTDIFESADKIKEKSTHYDDSAPFSTAWASIAVEEAKAPGVVLNRFQVPILGVIIQKIMNTKYQSAHLLHHSCDDFVCGYLDY
jgi:hypothetical protein